MNLFEWILERFNPGPVGTIRNPGEEKRWQPQTKLLVWILTVVGVGLFIFLLVSIFRSDYIWQWGLAFLVYLLLAYWLTPQPDHGNMGWMGGLMDNPFRVSDDSNRALFWFALLLLPGKIALYALQTIVNTIRIFR